jgi:hypothetical protein
MSVLLAERRVLEGRTSTSRRDASLKVAATKRGNSVRALKKNHGLRDAG